MRTFTLLLLILISSIGLSAQAFVVTDSNGEEQAYPFNIANFGPDFLDTVTCAELSLVDPANGCDPITTDLTGKIAVIDRGACNFSLKCVHAQDQGAVAVIIVNNQNTATFNMGAGDFGDQVEIPSVFITLINGDIIKDQMTMGTVSACMGNIILEKDLRGGLADVTTPLNVTVPAWSIAEPGSASFTPTTRFRNAGTEDLTNVNASVNIQFGLPGGSGSQVFDESSPIEPMLASGDSLLVAFPPFDYSGSDVGRYTVTYEFNSEAGEDTPYDNTVSYNFDVTDNIFSKGSWDYENNRPIVSNSWTVGGGGFVEMLAAFDVPNGLGYQVDSVQFFVTVNQPATLDGIEIDVRIYEWDDLNGNADNIIDNDEVSFIAGGNKAFDETATSGEFATVPVSDILTLLPGYVLDNDAKFIVGVRYTGSELLFIGFNNANSFALDNEIGNIPDLNADLPYIVSSSSIDGVPDFTAAGIFNDVRDHLSTAVYVNPVEVPDAVDELADNEATIELFPNPASQQLNANVTLDEVTSRLEYSITDMQGRQIFYVEKVNIKEDKNEFNIEQLPVGIYNLNITTDKGIKTERFSVQH